MTESRVQDTHALLEGRARPERPLISVVVPIYCEEQLLDTLHERLTTALIPLAPSYDHEILFVDDGSGDASLAGLVGIQERDSHVRVLGLSRNFGHQTAITAGIDAAEGDIVVTIDGDLQDPPELIADMVRKWEDGYEVVYGQRLARAGESRFKLVSAMVFYRTLNALSEIRLPLDTGDFRLMDRVVVDALKQMPEDARYIRGMVTWLGFRQYALGYQRDARYAGETKYTTGKMVRLALDGITSFSSKPLSVAMSFGALVTIASFVYLTVVIVYKLLYPEVALSGYASLVVIILFLGGVQLMSIGVLGTYLGRVFHESKRRPLYVVSRRYGFDAPSAEGGNRGVS